MRARASTLVVICCCLTLLGCGSLTTSPSWVGGGLAVHGPLQTPIDGDEEEPEPEPEPESAGTRSTAHPDAGPKIGVRHILVMHEESQQKPDGVDRSREAARMRADECLRKVRGGADFGDMVVEYSDEPGAAQRGGDLGMFSRRTMVKSFSDAAFSLELGEVSEVVETTYGFHLIKRIH